ncbi:MAG: iron chaperone [Dehalococcoidia bacterium]
MDVDAYIAAQPQSLHDTLAEVRRRVLAADPTATESINYGIPYYKHDGKMLISFGGAKAHWALYGTTRGSTLRFAHGELPDEDLIPALVGERIAAIEAEAAAKNAKRKQPTTGA